MTTHFNKKNYKFLVSSFNLKLIYFIVTCNNWLRVHNSSQLLVANFFNLLVNSQLLVADSKKLTSLSTGH